MGLRAVGEYPGGWKGTVRAGGTLTAWTLTSRPKALSMSGSISPQVVIDGRTSGSLAQLTRKLSPRPSPEGSCVCADHVFFLPPSEATIQTQWALPFQILCSMKSTHGSAEGEGLALWCENTMLVGCDRALSLIQVRSMKQIQKYKHVSDVLRGCQQGMQCDMQLYYLR